MLISEKIKIEKSREEQILTKVKNNLERIRQHQSQAAKMQGKEHFELFVLVIITCLTI
jgi:uncharacterized membrane protein (DUF106 family)